MQSVASLQHALCHCEKGAERGTRQSIVSRVTRMGLSLRLLVHSGSPRPQGARDDKVKGKECSQWHRYNPLFVIARRERSEGRGNPSCLEGWRAVMELAY